MTATLDTPAAAVNAAKTAVNTAATATATATADPRKQEFQHVLARHKRRGHEPNRIDDLEAVIDLARLQPCSCCCCPRPLPEEGGTRRNANEADAAETEVGGAVGEENDSPGATTSSMREEATPDPALERDAAVYVVDPQHFSRSSSSSGTKTNQATKQQPQQPQPKQKQLVCYGFHEYPGVYWYPHVLAPELQQRLAYAALTEYCEVEHQPPSPATASSSLSSTTTITGYRTNIDLVPPKPHERINTTTSTTTCSSNNNNESMWELWKQEHQYQQQHNGRTSKTTLPKKPATPPRPQYYRRLEKLAWSTLGYHYDWTQRSYNPQQQTVVLPPLLAQLSRYFVDHGRPTTTTPSLYRPSAAIVNYYTCKSTMGRHRDDLEHPQAWDQPIVSMSVGLAGIFLLGGTGTTEVEKAERTKETNYTTTSSSIDRADGPPPKQPGRTTTRALLLRPGDVLLMGGPSRLNYHAMARVVPDDALRQYEQTTWRRREEWVATSSSSSHPSPVSSSPCRRCTNPHGNDVITIQDLKKFTASTINNDDDDDDDDGDGNWNNTIHNTSSSSSSSSVAEDPNRLDAREIEYVTDYLQQHRININVRQVYPSPTTCTTAGE